MIVQLVRCYAWLAIQDFWGWWRTIVVKLTWRPSILQHLSFRKSRATRLASTALQCSHLACHAPSGVIAVKIVSSSEILSAMLPARLPKFNLEELDWFSMSRHSSKLQTNDQAGLNKVALKPSSDHPTSSSSGSKYLRSMAGSCSTRVPPPRVKTREHAISKTLKTSRSRSMPWDARVVG